MKAVYRIAGAIGFVGGSGCVHTYHYIRALSENPQEIARRLKEVLDEE